MPDYVHVHEGNYLRQWPFSALRTFAEERLVSGIAVLGFAEKVSQAGNACGAVGESSKWSIVGKALSLHCLHCEARLWVIGFDSKGLYIRKMICLLLIADPSR